MFDDIIELIFETLVIFFMVIFLIKDADIKLLLFLGVLYLGGVIRHNGNHVGRR